MSQRRRRGRHYASRGGVSWATASRRGLLALLSAAVLFVTGVSWATVDSLDRDTNTAEAIGDAADLEDGSTDILLVGKDSRTDGRGEPLPLDVLRALRTEASEGRYTDAVILIRVPDDGSAAHVVSIPRDAMVTIPDTDHTEPLRSVYRTVQDNSTQNLRERGFSGETRIEREATQEARRALVGTVQDLTGVRVDHYGELNLFGFFMLSKAIGGVEVCLNEATSDPNSGADFPAGRQTLSGGDALSFVRQSDELPRGDLDRIVRQQAFLAAMANKLLSAETLTDTGRLSELVEATRRSVVLDRDWDLLSFAQQMQGISAEAVSFVTVPVVEVIDGEDGQQVVTVDREQVRAFVTGLVDSPAADAGQPDSAPDPAAAGQESAAEVRSSAGTQTGPAAAAPPPITADGVPCVN